MKIKYDQRWISEMNKTTRYTKTHWERGTETRSGLNSVKFQSWNCPQKPYKSLKHSLKCSEFVELWWKLHFKHLSWTNNCVFFPLTLFSWSRLQMNKSQIGQIIWWKMLFLVQLVNITYISKLFQFLDIFVSSCCYFTVMCQCASYPVMFQFKFTHEPPENFSWTVLGPALAEFNFYIEVCSILM